MNIGGNGSGSGAAAQLAVSTTYAALKALRDGGKLVPGTWYRITDYQCTTTQADTQSAGHQFDIIVRADDAYHLNESAFAAHHNGDTYFTNCKLETWSLKYCIDNDTHRFAWADTEDGKGVVYRMVDEWNNDCPYDFKNIMFKRFLVGGDGNLAALDAKYLGFDSEEAPRGMTIDASDFIWCYTFSALDDNVSDASLNELEFNENDYAPNYCTSNIIKECFFSMFVDGNSNVALKLNNIAFINDAVYDGLFSFNSQPYGNEIGENCKDITFLGNSFANRIGEFCYKLTFGNSCNSNTFGNSCNSNTFGNGFQWNTFGNNCYYNSFGNGFQWNTFGNSCSYNTFGNSCNSNTFGNSCYENTFGNDCSNNTFGNDCYYNSFGNGCSNNTFGNNCYYNSFGNYCQRLSVFDGVRYCSVTGGSANAPVMNAQILNGTSGSSEQNKLNIAFAANKAYTQVAAKNEAGNLKIWNPAALVQ